MGISLRSFPSFLRKLVSEGHTTQGHRNKDDVDPKSTEQATL